MALQLLNQCPDISFLSKFMFRAYREARVSRDGLYRRFSNSFLTEESFELLFGLQWTLLHDSQQVCLKKVKVWHGHSKTLFFLSPLITDE